jgi:predicted porin
MSDMQNEPLQSSSSVVVYGRLSGGLAATDTTSVNNVSSTSGTQKVKSLQLDDNSLSSTYFGIRGSENLPYGMKAQFRVESTMSVTTGTSNTFGAARQAWIGLEKADLGSLSIGTQYTPIYDAVILTDPGSMAGYGGSVITPSHTGQAQNLASGTVPGTFNYAGFQNNLAYAGRSTHSIKVASAAMNGFKGTVFGKINKDQLGTTSLTSDTGKTSNTGVGGSVSYENGPINATFATQKFTDETKRSNALTFATQSALIGAAPTANVNATDNQSYAGATYDFGTVKAHAQYVERKLESKLDSSNSIKRTAQQIGVSARVTEDLKAWASYGTGKYEVASATLNSNTFVGGRSVAGTVEAKFNGLQTGATYKLSRRTLAYGVAGYEKQDAAKFINTTTDTSYKGTNYAFGLTHSF